MTSDKWDYIIDGKNNSFAGMFISAVIAVIFVVLTIDQLSGGQKKSVFLGAAFAFIAMPSLWIAVRLAIRYFCFKICIGADEFYIRTGLFNGTAYQYSDVKNARTALITSRAAFQNAPSQPVYFYYFYFTDNSGKLLRLDRTSPDKSNVLKEYTEKA